MAGSRLFSLFSKWICMVSYPTDLSASQGLTIYALATCRLWDNGHAVVFRVWWEWGGGLAWSVSSDKTME